MSQRPAIPAWVPLRALPAFLCLAFLFLLVASTPATSQDAPAPDAQPTAGDATDAPTTTLAVGTLMRPPFVREAEDGLTGMAIDIWERAAATMGVTYDYTPYPTMRALMDATAAGEIDVAVSSITITQTRAERVDFTQPWFDSGLRITC